MPPAPQGYAYILTHPGVPCVFYDHVWSSGMMNPSRWRRMKKLLVKHKMIDGGSTSVMQPLQTCIMELIALRRRSGINALSQVCGNADRSFRTCQCTWTLPGIERGGGWAKNGGLGLSANVRDDRSLRKGVLAYVIGTSLKAVEAGVYACELGGGGAREGKGEGGRKRGHVPAA